MAKNSDHSKKYEKPALKEFGSIRNLKKYEKPALKKFGSVKDLTLTHCKSGAADGGGAPNNKKMCVSAAPQVDEHRNLVGHRDAQAAYQREIQRAVRPGSVVMDLGTGTGLHALFACAAGAKKVYAIESNSIISIAKEVIAANGFSDRVEFIQKDSTKVQLPERVDVLISNLGFFYAMKSLPHAAREFLKEGGEMIPESTRLNLVPYTDQAFFDANIRFWDDQHYGFDFASVRKMASHHAHYLWLDPKKFMAEPTELPIIKYAKVADKPLHFEMETKIGRAGLVHALGGWYDFSSKTGPFLSARPPITSDLWTNFILPFATPIPARRNDRWRILLDLDMNSFSETSIWSWRVEVNGEERLKQSSFDSILI